MTHTTLQNYLADWTLEEKTRRAVADTILAIATSGIAMSHRVAQGDLAGPLGRVTARAGDLDEQKVADVLANDGILSALKSVPVAALASEELEQPAALDEKAPLLVAVDPLDGSSNVDANVSFGMIFSILPRHPSSSGEAAFLRPGSHQLGAGLIVYGPQTNLALDSRRGNPHFHARSGLESLSAVAQGRGHPARDDGIRHQHVERTFLGRAHPHLRA